MIQKFASRIRLLLLIVALLFVHKSGFGQKIIQKEFDAQTIQSVIIVDDALYKISIVSGETKKIKLILLVAGEYSENIVIEEKRQYDILYLTTGYTPFFKKEDDKLAAHKIMALQLEISVPRNILIKVKSKLASVITDRSFRELAIALENGSCVLNKFSGNAHLKTLNGNISVFGDKNLSGRGVSQSGTVKINLPPNQQYLVFAETINGDISMEQIK